MRVFHAALSMLILWAMLLVAPLHAQAPGDEEGIPVPPAPPNLVLDQARLFARHPGELAPLVETLKLLEEKHGFRLYFAIYDSLIGRSPREQAATLQKEWLGDQPGMILLLESDSLKWISGQAAPVFEEVEPGNRLERRGPNDVSISDVEKIDAALKEELKAVSSDRQKYAMTLGTGLARGISQLLDQRVATPANVGRSRTILLFVGLLAAAGLIALLVLAGLGRAEARARKRYLFPKVAVGVRLGAPYGGGKVSTRDFGNRKG